MVADKHKIIKELIETGITEKQAEVLVERFVLKGHVDGFALLFMLGVISALTIIMLVSFFKK